ncbi:penicillin acylase family protein, partial [Shewanella algae]|uniref:penicillin acylase family protein n=1 Tax=Shewanella algae TaxID=38313 RepID=UPI00313B7D49
VPASTMPEALRTARTACSDCGLRDARDIGSNNFAVAAAHGAQGRAIVANDMHLDLRVPGTWFKARMQWQDAAGRHDIAGVTL